MTYHELPSQKTGKSPRHVEASIKSQYSSTSRIPLKHQIVYSAVVFPQGTSRIFGILYNNKVYTKISALAPTGVMPTAGFTLLPERDYNIYKQWLQTPSKSKTRLDAERMQWIEDNAENLIKEGNEKESARLSGQSEYERGQKLNQEFQIPISSLKIGSFLEFQFDKSIWIVAEISKDCVYARQNKDDTPRNIGCKTVTGYKLL